MREKEILWMKEMWKTKAKLPVVIGTLKVKDLNYKGNSNKSQI